MTKTALRIVFVSIVVSLLAAGCSTNGQSEITEPMVGTDRAAEGMPEAVPEKMPETAPEKPEVVPEEKPEVMGEEAVAEEKPKTMEEEPAVDELRVLDDFEGDIQWKPVDWDNANSAEVSAVQTVEGSGLRIQASVGDREKAAVSRAMDPGIDTTGYDKLRLRVELKGEEPMKIALAFTTGAYYEAPPQELQPGMNEIAVDLDGKDFKTTPDWEPDQELKGRHYVKAIFLLLYTSEDREIVVDELRMVK